MPWLTLDRDRVLRALWATMALLVAIYVALQVFRLRTGHDTLYGLTMFFDLDEEASLPTFFSICLLLFATGMLALIARGAKHRGDPLTRQWTGLALGFFLLALDEAASVHEKLSRPIDLLRGLVPVPASAWVVAGVLIVLGVFLTYSSFLRRLPTGTRRAFLLAGAVYVGGAIGCEIPEGEHFIRHGRDLGYVLYVAGEEGLEMSGVILFLGALFACFTAQGGAAGITVRPSPVATSTS